MYFERKKVKIKDKRKNDVILVKNKKEIGIKKRNLINLAKLIVTVTKAKRRAFGKGI